MNKWFIDDVALDTIAYNIETIGGLGVPEKRGSNVVMPYKSGARYIKKPFAERVISLGMWVRGVEQVGETINPYLTYQRNLDTLSQLFGAEGLHTLKRIMPDGTARTITCEVVDKIEFTRDVDGAPNVARFVVDLNCPDVFWLDTIQTVFTMDAVATPVTGQLTNSGTANHRGAVIKITGEANNPKILNLTNGVWVKYNSALIAGDTLVIDCGEFSAVQNGNNHVGLITHSGDPAFMVLAPGINQIQLICADAPSCTLEIDFNAAYM